MSDMLAIAEAALRNSLTAVDSVSRNIANASTHGYKRELRTDADFAAYMDSTAITHAARDWSAGPMQFTGASASFAIEGEGWFQLRSPQGTLLTRDGAFRVDNDGKLVSQQGWPVLLDAEASIPNGPLSLRADNELWAGDVRVGKFQLADVHAASLEALGPGLYRSKSAALDAPAGASVRQGFVEGSNVNSLSEMVTLIDSVRQAEAAQRMMRAYDEATETALTTLGEF
jgi:flagellar basal-body rod protein FlgF